MRTIIFDEHDFIKLVEEYMGSDAAAYLRELVGDVDEDIFAETLAEIRSMQVVRRLIIEGDLVAAEEKADEATEIWSRAFLRNPRDPMLLDRIDRLSRNPAALLSVHNVATAAKCYESIIVINPKDVSTIMKYGVCLRRLGQKEMADQVFERAMELRKQR